MKTYVFRLHSGQGLREEIEAFVKEQDLKAGVILICVGSLKRAVLRMAGAKEIKEYEGPLEIVSFEGTVGEGGSHMHISIADKDGNVFGGHLKEGSVVDTTAEVIIGVLENTTFKRKFDDETGFDELVIE